VTRTKQFPDDENGDVLRRMAADGIDLVSPRIVDFEHCFPNEASARAFHTAVLATVLKAKLVYPEPEEGNGWEVQCKVRLIPSHAAITETELRLGDLARSFGGSPDGWGSLSNPDGSPAD
jgi:Regulator of ribonuclease activity B